MVGQYSILSYDIPNQDDQICPIPPNEALNTPINEWVQYDRSWCSFEVVDQGTFIVELIYACVLVLLLVFFTKRCYELWRHGRNKKKKLEKFGGFYIIIHRIVAVWFVCTMTRVTLSIYTYLNQINQQQNKPDPYIKSPIVALAVTYTVFNFMCGFIVNLLVLLIPYKWVSVCLLGIKEEQRLTFQLRKTVDRWFVVLTVMKVYIYLRFIFVFCLIFQPFLFYFPQIMPFITDFRYYRCLIPLYNYLYMIVQSSFIILFEVFAGYALLQVRKLDIIKISDKVYKKMRYQYAFLLLSIMGRVGVNIVRILLYDSTDQYYKPNSHCKDQNTDNDLTLIAIVSVHHVLMHLVPVSVSLYIYRLTIQNREDSEFILNSEYYLSELKEKSNLDEKLCEKGNMFSSRKIFQDLQQCNHNQIARTESVKSP